MTRALTVVCGASAVLLAAASPSSASVVTPMDLATLTRLSPVVVRGEVESGAVASGTRGEIVTWTTVRVEERLKGAEGRSRIAVAVPGGMSPARVSRLVGAPRFRVGERVVLFARPTKGGLLTVTGLFQGKFRVEGDEAVQDEGEGASVTGSGARLPRTALGPFLAAVRGLVRRHPGPALADAVRAEAPTGAVEVPPSFTLLPIIPFRHFEPDSGLPVSFLFNPAGSPVPPAVAQAGFAAARQGWTDVSGASITVADGGLTTQACRVFFDGGVVSHGDPCDQFPAFDPDTCSGILAVTGVSGFTLEGRTVNGVRFLRMTEADMIFNADTECFYAGPDAAANYEEVLSHEMGHALGLGHACGDTFSPACVPGTEEDDALMRAFAHGGGRGGAPRASDVDGIRFVYPTAGFIDLRMNAPAFSTGETLSLRADLNGTAAVDLYLLLLHPAGFFVSMAPGLPVNTLVPAATDLPLTFATDQPLLSFAWTGTEQAGGYGWYAFLARTGTDPANPANWVGADSEAFTFAP